MHDIGTKIFHDAAQAENSRRVRDLDDTARGGWKAQTLVVGLVLRAERASRASEEASIVAARPQRSAQSQDHEFRATGGSSIVIDQENAHRARVPGHCMIEFRLRQLTLIP